MRKAHAQSDEPVGDVREQTGANALGVMPLRRANPRAERGPLASSTPATAMSPELFLETNLKSGLYRFRLKRFVRISEIVHVVGWRLAVPIWCSAQETPKRSLFSWARRLGLTRIAKVNRS